MNAEILETASSEMWNSAKSIYIMSLKTAEEKSQAERYLGMITSVSSESNVFKIFTTSSFAAERIRNEYASKLKGSFLVAGASPEIELEVVLDEHVQSAMPTRPKITIPTYTSDKQGEGERRTSFSSTLPLNDDYTFEAFVRGPSNSFALSAAEGIVKNPGNPGSNPLFIHGGTGLGKTHLMQAIGNRLHKLHPNMAICYLTAETFLNEYVNSLQNGQKEIEEFRQRYRSLDVLLLDDVQFLQKGKNVQDEFFNTFNALRDKHRQIVMTSDVAPKNLPSIEARLISRFEGGMVQEIESPSYETRLAILKKKSENYGTKVPESALEFIADNIKSHVRAMEGALAKVSVLVNAEPNIIINNDVLGKLLKDFIVREQSMRKLSIEEIQQACAKKYGTTMADILSHERTQTLVTPRQLAMYIARKYTSKGLQEIATAFGKKHATIINGVKTITERLSNEHDLKIELEEILTSLGYRMSDMME